jgi:hypothetical protein
MNRHATAAVMLTTLLLARADADAAAAAPDAAPAATPPAASAPASQPGDERAALEAKFMKDMSGVALVGFFTDSNHPDAAPRAERYIITKVTKLSGDLYVFAARFKMSKGEINLPLIIPVKWAGDTPVISVTKMGIPGMGTYTARVMIYEGKYAGMWTGTNHGGNLWGTIEPLKVEEMPADAKGPAGDRGKP